MLLSEIVSSLRGEGLRRVTLGRIYYAMRCGHVARPRQDAAGNYQFSKRHLSQLRTYLARPVTRGRKPACQRAMAEPPDGEADARVVRGA